MNKKPILILAATMIFFAAGNAYAQTSKQIQTPAACCPGTHGSLKNGIYVVKGGKVYVRENDQWVLLKKPRTLSNGSIIAPERTLTGKNGKSVTLSNEQMVDAAGNISTTMGKAGIQCDMVYDGIIMMHGGTVYIRDHEKWVRMNREKVIASGATVNADGSIVDPDGTKRSLKNGEMVCEFGKIFWVEGKPGFGIN